VGEFRDGHHPSSIDEYDDPVPNASVTLDGSAAGETNANGVLSVPIESAGNHTIGANARNLAASATIQGVEPAPDETPTATPTPTPVPTTTEPSGALGPGFGPVAAIIALLAVALLGARSRRS